MEVNPVVRDLCISYFKRLEEHGQDRQDPLRTLLMNDPAFIETCHAHEKEILEFSANLPPHFDLSVGFEVRFWMQASLRLACKRAVRKVEKEISEADLRKMQTLPGFGEF